MELPRRFPENKRLESVKNEMTIERYKVMK